ncbi:MAG: VanZ family protein [Bacteroidetes bacterium]|jgi:hypothetical protein|nr:VanZ family protein [Bacteroidota bacterium]MBT6686045.1 VanZ family protein [Bacteroidota bacterium]MBT7142735.1 VanZ family protein [Bacteroidota bacterium]MBT7491324.1 VanZ family protein [Bacteroidota bacterium]
MILKTFWKSISYFVFIAILSIIPNSKLEKFDIERIYNFQIFLDKIEHAIAFFIFSFLFWYDFKKQNKYLFLKNYSLLFSIIFSFTIGILIEIVQEYISIIDRTGNILDFYSNNIGIILFVFLFFVFRNFIYRISKIE